MSTWRTTKILLGCGVVGPLLFIVVFLIEGATRAGYRPWHHFVSQLSLSDQGWMQIVNFIVCGVLVLAYAGGLRRVLGSTAGSVLMGLFGLGLVVAGVFVTDPTLGYPPGAGAAPTAHGAVHGLAGLVTFMSVALAAIVLSRRFSGGWRWYSVISGVLVIVLFIAFLTLASLDQRGTLTNAPVGLVQRIAIIVGWVWAASTAYRLLRRAATHA
jgi:hypothetical membrane protein